MKKRIALVHSVSTLAISFKDKLLDYLQEDVMIYNIWDDFLAINPNEVGEFTMQNRNRLFYDLRSAELTGADLIVVTCSTLTPAVEQIRPFIAVPVIAIDDALGRAAVQMGKRVCVLATAGSAAGSTVEKLHTEAGRLGKTIEIDTLVVEEAFTALKQMAMPRHDDLVLSSAASLTGYDGIILAQASMAHLDMKIADLCHTLVLSSPQLCMTEVKQALAMMKIGKA